MLEVDALAAAYGQSQGLFGVSAELAANRGLQHRTLGV